MKFFAVVLLSTLLASSSSLPLSEAKCDVQNFIDCYDSYLHLFDLSISNFPSFEQYVQGKVAYLNVHGKEGVKTICDANGRLNSCIGPNSVDACAAASSFSDAFGISIAAAREFRSDFYIANYDCGAGFNDSMKYFDCFHGVYRTERAKLKKCQRDFNDSLKHGFQCSYLTTLMDCNTKIFEKRCGTGSDHFICNVIKTGIQANTHACDRELPICP